MNRPHRSSVAVVVGVVVTLVVGVVGAGCSDVTVPDGALVSCGDDDACPDELVCEPTSRLCVRALVGEELQPPTVTVAPLLIGGPFIDAGGDIVVDVAFASDPLRAPTLTLFQDSEQVASFDVEEAGARSWRGTLTASTELPEGRLAVFVDAFDARGLPRRFPGGVVDVDVTPPVIGNVSYSRLPDPRLTPVAFDIVDETPIGPAIEVRLAFSLNEPSSETEAPTARLEGSSLPLVLDETVENPVTFRLAWPDAAALAGLDGTFDLAARVVDRAGNVTDEVLQAAVVVDVTPPSAPAVDVAGAVVFERAPWGRAEADVPDVFTVRAEGGVVDEGDIVVVTSDAAGQREIGRTVADALGFGGLERGFRLDTGDRREVYVVVHDVAGNRSAPTRVRDTLWLASPGGKIVGDDIVNPHTFEELPILAAQLAQGGITERGSDDGVGGHDDNAAVVTTGAGTFTALASDDGDVLSPAGTGLLFGSAVGHDPVRGLTVVFGGSLPDIDGAQFFGQRVRCTAGVNDVFVRRADGRFRRETFAPTAPRPPAMATARFTFDTTTNLLVLVGRPAVDRGLGAPEMWSYDGADFVQLCTDDACADTVPAGLQDVGFVADPARRVLVAHGGGLGPATFEFDGRRWRPACGGVVADCVAPAAGPGTLVYDDVAHRVVWFDGAALAAWDGVAWTPLCTDAACAAGAPPPRVNTSAAWDRRRQRLVTFGGDIAGGATCSFGSQTFPRDNIPDDVARATPPSGDTWEFDGARWSQRVTPSSPPPRAQHHMAWDERAGAVLVVGGDDCACSGSVRDPGFRDGNDEDAWEFNGLDWQRVDAPPAAPPGFTRRAPLPLGFHAMVPSSATGGVLAHGDQAGDHFVLVKDGRFYDAAASEVGASAFLSSVTASPDGSIFALEPGGGPFAQQLVDGTFQPVCTPDPTCGGGASPPFIGPMMAHDGERLVVFGGARNLNQTFGSVFSDSALDETFTFDATLGLQRRCADGSCGPTPGRRIRGHLTSTATAGEVLLFGGFPGDGTTWIFRGNTWTAATTTTTPRQRQDHIQVFDPARDAVMLTGGTDDNPGNDTRGTLPERVLPGFLDVVYEWTGDWSEARVADPEGDGRPAPRFAAAAAADPEGGVVLVGGVPSPRRLFNGPVAGELSDVWSWDGGAARAPAQRFRVKTTAAGLGDDDVITGAVLRWYGVADDATGASAPPRLAVWNGAAYVDVDGVPCGPAVGPGCVSSVLDAGLTRRALVGPARELIVVARAPENGTAPGYSAVSTDFVEVALTTHR